MNDDKIVIIVLVIWNLVTFLVMGLDKYKAKKHKRRIPEKTLFAMSFLFGGMGVLLGMSVFHHKTKHASFKILVPLGIIVNAALVVYLPAYFQFHL